MTASRRRWPWAVIAGLLSVAACASTQPRRERPAVILDPTPESRATLAAAVGAALHGAPVALADDALSSASTLVVERARPRGGGAAPLNGRETAPPQHFRLVQSGHRCVLVHDETGQRFTLVGTACVPAAEQPPARHP